MRAHLVLQLKKKLALLKNALQATARPFLAVLQPCNARFFSSARANVSVHSAVSWACVPLCSTDVRAFLSAVGVPAARFRTARAHIWFFSSKRSCRCLKIHLKQRRSLSWQFCSRAAQGFSAARANVSVHSTVSWARVPLRSTDVRAFSWTVGTLAAKFRTACAHI